MGLSAGKGRKHAIGIAASGLLVAVACFMAALALAAELAPAAAVALAPDDAHASAAVAEGEPGAVRSEIDYTIVFRPEGGVGDMPDQQVTLVEGQQVASRLSACAFTREGWEFAGWRTAVPADSNLSPVIVPDGQELSNLSYAPGGDAGAESLVGLVGYSEHDVIVLAAVWKADAGDGAETSFSTARNAQRSRGVQVSSTATCSLYKYSKDGFHGYLTLGDSAPAGYGFRHYLCTVPVYSSTPVYHLNNPYNVDFWLFTTNIDEYNALISLGWDPKGIAFYSDDAEGIPVYRFYSSVIDGAHSWFTIESNSLYGVQEGVGFYGVKYYDVAFDGNGATAGSMPSQRMQYGVSYNLEANAFSRAGYAFAGWTGPDGRSYSDRQSVSNLTAVSDGTVTLTAQWTPLTSTVSYDANGGAGTVVASTVAYGSPCIVPASSFTRVGYAFKDWNDAADGSGQSYAPGASIVPTSDMVLYAQWRAVALAFSVPTEIDFALKADGALIGPGDGVASITNRGAYGMRASGIRTQPAAEVAFVEEARSAGEYRVAMSPGTGAPLSLCRYVAADFTALPDAPSWRIAAGGALSLCAISGDCGGADAIPAEGARFGSIEWRLTGVSLSVSYDANGGIGSMPAHAMSEGASFAAPGCLFSRAGCRFAGWSTEADGAGVVYKPGDAVLPGESLVLYARWE